jgi:hypothetical protein
MTPLLHQVSHHAIVLTRYWEGVKHLFLGAGHSRTTLPLPLTALLYCPEICKGKYHSQRTAKSKNVLPRSGCSISFLTTNFILDP